MVGAAACEPAPAARVTGPPVRLTVIKATDRSMGNTFDMQSTKRNMSTLPPELRIAILLRSARRQIATLNGWPEARTQTVSVNDTTGRQPAFLTEAETAADFLES